MTERDRSAGGNAKVRLRLVKSLRLDSVQGCQVWASPRYTAPLPSLAGWVGQRLISTPDAAISNTLRQQTRVILALLTRREQEVLRMRYGIGLADDEGPQELRRLALTRVQIAAIEAQALRKLRQPSRGLQLTRTTRI